MGFERLRICTKAPQWATVWRGHVQALVADEASIHKRWLFARRCKEPPNNKGCFPFGAADEFFLPFEFKMRNWSAYDRQLTLAYWSKGSLKQAHISKCQLVGAHGPCGYKTAKEVHKIVQLGLH